MSLNSNFLYRWRFVWGIGVLGVILIAVLIIGLIASPRGLSSEELEHIGAIDSFRAIIDQPVNPLTRFLQVVSLKVFGLTTLGARLATVVIAAGALLAFFFVLKNLYWTRLAMLGTFLLGTSSWFLHQAVAGTDAISVVLTLSLIVLTSHRAFTTKSIAWTVAAGISIAAGLYTPLIVYVLMASGIALLPEIRIAVRKITTNYLFVGAASFVVALLPLAYAIIQDLQVAKTLLNIPDVLPSLTDFFINISDTFSYIFWRSFESPAYHFDQLPMLDVFTVAMVALGLFQFERSWPSPRSRALFASGIAVLLGVSLSLTDQSAVVLLPFIYVLAAIGASTLLSQWQDIFPRNPIARTLGVLPIALLLLLTMMYHGNRYFVAWNSASITKSAYDQRPTLLYEQIRDLEGVQRVLIVTSPSDRDRFGYIQTRFTDEVRVVVVSDDIYLQDQAMSAEKEQIYVISGSRSLDAIQDTFGAPAYVQASEIDSSSSLYVRFDK